MEREQAVCLTGVGSVSHSVTVVQAVCHSGPGSVSQLVVCVTVAERAQAVCHSVGARREVTAPSHLPVMGRSEPQICDSEGG